MGLEDDVALFKELRERLLGRIEDEEASLRERLDRTREAKRDVSGRGRRGSATEPGKGTQGDRILVWLRANPGRRTVAEIAAGAGMSRASANQALLALVAHRLVARSARGLYEVAGPRQLPAHEEQEPAEPEEPAVREDPPPARALDEGPPRRETPADRLRRMQKARLEKDVIQ